MGLCCISASFEDWSSLRPRGMGTKLTAFWLMGLKKDDSSKLKVGIQRVTV